MISMDNGQVDADGVGNLECPFKTARTPSLNSPDFLPVGGMELQYERFDTEFVVDGVIGPGQATIIAGPEKTLKTCIACDLAVSLATGTPFLGKFEVVEPRRTWFLSSESGKGNIIKTIVRVASARGIDSWDILKDICISTRVPQLGDDDDIRDVSSVMRAYGIRAAIFDPLYLMMGNAGGATGDLTTMGGLLNDLKRFLSVGVTPVVCHHFSQRTDRNRYLRPKLEDVSMAGPRQNFGNWILLNRRSRYESDGIHELWATIGGREGHSSNWGLDIDEGLVDHREVTGWGVSVLDPRDAKRKTEARKKSRQRQSAEAKQERIENRIADHDRRVIQAAASLDGSRGTASRIRRQTKPQLTYKAVAEVLARLTDAGVFSVIENSNQGKEEYQLTQPPEK